MTATMKSSSHGACATLALTIVGVLREDEIPRHYRTVLLRTWARSFLKRAVRQGNKRFANRRALERNDGEGEARA